MHWYGGSIAEAVTLSKQKNAIFVVFVEGDNDLSQEMAQTIDTTAVVSRLSNQANFLAIKLKSGSANYTHFAQIYQFVPVPSLFFIGRNGTPLEVVCAGVEANNLATRIDRILEEHRKEKPLLVQPSTSSQNVKEQTVNLLQSEAASSAPVKPEPVKAPETRAKEPEASEPAAKIPKTDKPEENKSEEYEVVCDGDVCIRRPKAADDPGTSKQTQPMETQSVSAPIPAVPEVPAYSAAVESSDPPAGTSAEVSPTDSVRDMEDKLEKAKELIEARRREKADKEKELEKQKEMERRAVGKGVTELKKWQADQELKQIQEERKREKLEDNLARQRILEQIAQDRAERRARDAPPAPPAPPAPHVPHAPTAAAPVPATSGDGGSRARIQFKLPDGSSHTAHFDAEDTLGDVQRYVAENLQLPASSFTLWTAFPRRELCSAAASLRSLQLAPSAALLVLPRRPAAAPVAAPPTHTSFIAFFTHLFTSLILAPSQQFYAWIRQRLFPAASPRGPPSPPSAPSPRPSPPPPGLRRRGNVHRLPGDSAGDDENNTWNGNSTQQM